MRSKASAYKECLPDVLYPALNVRIVILLVLYNTSKTFVFNLFRTNIVIHLVRLSLSTWLFNSNVWRTV